MAPDVPTLDRAREAAAAAEWREAYDLYGTLDLASLTADDLEAYADAAWWLSRVEECIRIRQRAYGARAAAGDDRRAGYLAWLLYYDHYFRGEHTVASGWFQRAHRHLDDVPPCLERGFLLVSDGDWALYRGDAEDAQRLAQEVAEIGRDSGSPDLLALAIELEGRALIRMDRVDEGYALLDEAMTLVISGQLTPMFTGWIYCQVVDACVELADYRRAGDWTEAAMAWCETLPSDTPYHGLCRVRWGEVMAVRGELVRAEVEAHRAAEELRVYPPSAAEAHYLAGEIRRRLGDLAGAEEAFREAHALGRDPQPGLALVRLAQGRAEAATSSLETALASDAWRDLDRVRLLAARAEVAIALGDLEAGAEAERELDAVRRRLTSPWCEATAATTRGRLLLAREDPAGALGSLRPACRAWGDLRAPYETAVARALLGRALRATGDEDGARRELELAREAFARIGARTEVRAVELLERGGLPGGLTDREAQVLRLVAAGRTNRQIAETLFISEHTVARHIQNIFGKRDVSSRGEAAAFAFAHGLA